MFPAFSRSCPREWSDSFGWRDDFGCLEVGGTEVVDVGHDVVGRRLISQRVRYSSGRAVRQRRLDRACASFRVLHCPEQSTYNDFQGRLRRVSHFMAPAILDYLRQSRH